MDLIRHNAGKIALAAALLILALIFYPWGGCDSGPPRSDKVQFICTETGKIYWLPREPRIPPVVNPDTQNLTLVPCYEKEDGKLAVSGRMIDVLRELTDKSQNNYVDLETLEVRVKP